jgi:hypothetical protein
MHSLSATPAAGLTLIVLEAHWETLFRKALPEDIYCYKILAISSLPLVSR